MSKPARSAVLDFRRADPEARVGLPVGRHTTPSIASSLLLGILLMLGCVAFAMVIRDDASPSRTFMYRLILGYYGIAPAELFLSCWSVAFLVIKYLKIRAQRQALGLQVIPRDPGFELTAASSPRVVQAIESGVLGADRFLYLKRILVSLRSMKNVGRMADIDDKLQAAAGIDQSILESGYTLLKGFTWAIPVLGFIGTVIGMSEAMREFGVQLNQAVSGAQVNVNDVSKGLVRVLMGLDTAFVTTGEALILVFLIHMGQVFVRDADETLLDDAREEAHTQIGARVRVDGARVP